MSTAEPQLEARNVESKEVDIEKNGMMVDSNSGSQTAEEKGSIRSHDWKQRLLTWGVEIRGITPVPVEERTDTRFVNIFSLWFTMSVTLLP